MDLSALIFVGLAVAWAAYLIPKALRHHEEDAVSRPVERFSGRVRVLARREAVSSNRTELVTRTEAPEPASEQAPAEVSADVPEPARRGTPAAARAAKRRRRVLALVLLGNAVVITLAAFAVLAWPYVAVPAGLLVGWLVACRLMVRRERAAARRTRRVEAAPTPVETTAETDEIAVQVDAAADSAEYGWDPVPMTLPTYVDKAPAGRTVRTIDLDSTGVWSSGRNEADSRLAREAEASEQPATDADADERRASGA